MQVKYAMETEEEQLAQIERLPLEIRALFLAHLSPDDMRSMTRTSLYFMEAMDIAIQKRIDMGFLERYNERKDEMTTFQKKKYAIVEDTIIDFDADYALSIDGILYDMDTGDIVDRNVTLFSRHGRYYGNDNRLVVYGKVSQPLSHPIKIMCSDHFCCTLFDGGRMVIENRDRMLHNEISIIDFDIGSNDRIWILATMDEDYRIIVMEFTEAGALTLHRNIDFNNAYNTAPTRIQAVSKKRAVVGIPRIRVYMEFVLEVGRTVVRQFNLDGDITLSFYKNVVYAIFHDLSTVGSISYETLFENGGKDANYEFSPLDIAGKPISVKRYGHRVYILQSKD